MARRQREDEKSARAKRRCLYFAAARRGWTEGGIDLREVCARGIFLQSSETVRRGRRRGGGSVRGKVNGCKKQVFRRLPQIAAGCRKLQQVAADCSRLPQVVTSCSRLQQAAAGCNRLRLESESNPNPIRIRIGIRIALANPIRPASLGVSRERARENVLSREKRQGRMGRAEEGRLQKAWLDRGQEALGLSESERIGQLWAGSVQGEGWGRGGVKRVG